MSGLDSTTAHKPCATAREVCSTTTTSVTATRKPERSHERGNMALTDRLDTTPQRIHGTPCSVGALEDRLAGTDEGAALQSMLHELGWSGRRVYEAITAEGYDVGQQTINRHRSKACRCFR